MALLNAHNLELAKFASKEESRFTLNGIQVTPTETIVTDGRVLLKLEMIKTEAKDFPEVPGVPLASDTWEPFFLETDVAGAVLKSLPKREPIPVLNCAAVAPNGESVTILTTDLSRSTPTTIRRSTVSFPDFKRIGWPIEDQEFSIQVNAAALAEVLAFAGKLTGSRRGMSNPPACVLRFKSASEAIRIDTGDKQKLMALVMPSWDNNPSVADTTPGLIRHLKQTCGKVYRPQAEARLAKLEAQVKELREALGATAEAAAE